MQYLLILLVVLVGCSSDSPPANQTTITLSVQGMHCNSCVQSITTSVEQLDGVSSCSVSLEEERAVVVIDDPTVESAVLEMIRTLQFTVKPIDE